MRLIRSGVLVILATAYSGSPVRSGRAENRFKEKRRHAKMDDWQIDVVQQVAHHDSGLQINFEGRPQSRHFSGTPSRVPQGMASLKLVQLIREGYQAYEEAFSSISQPPASGAFTQADSQTDSQIGGQSGSLTEHHDAGVKVRHRRRRRVPE